MKTIDKSSTSALATRGSSSSPNAAAPGHPPAEDRLVDFSLLLLEDQAAVEDKTAVVDRILDQISKKVDDDDGDDKSQKKQDHEASTTKETGDEELDRPKEILFLIRAYMDAGLVPALVGAISYDFVPEHNDPAYYHGVLHFYHCIFTLLMHLSGFSIPQEPDQPKNAMAVAAGGLVGRLMDQGTVDCLLDFMSSKWGEHDAYCVSTTFCALTGFLAGLDQNKESPGIPSLLESLVEAILPAVLDQLAHHATVDSPDDDSSTLVCFGCQVLDGCFHGAPETAVAHKPRAVQVSSFRVDAGYTTSCYLYCYSILKKGCKNSYLFRFFETDCLGLFDDPCRPEQRNSRGRTECLAYSFGE